VGLFSSISFPLYHNGGRRGSSAARRATASGVLADSRRSLLYHFSTFSVGHRRADAGEGGVPPLAVRSRSCAEPAPAPVALGPRPPCCHTRHADSCRP